MRVHIIGINYWPEATGIAVFSTGRAEYLADCGHRVTVCTAVPYYPQWRIVDAYRGRGFAREERAGVDIRRCPVYVPGRVTPIRRILHEASFIAAAFLRCLFGPRPDLVVVVSPPLGLAVIAVLLSRLWRVPYVFHVADLQPDTALDLGMVRGGRLARFLYAIERFGYRHAALVSTLTEAMRARIVSKGIDERKVVLFSDWADPALFTLDPMSHAGMDIADLRRELGLGDGFIALHVGNMGVKQGLDVVIDAAERTRAAADVTYVLVGDGAVRPLLEARVRAAKLSNVLIRPLLPRDQFMRLLTAADVCLVTQQRSVADVVFPSKILTLLAAGKPVVASVSAGSEVARVIAASRAGEVVQPEEPEALAVAVDQLRRDPSRRERMGLAGRAYARHHWERWATLQYLGRTIEAVAAGRVIDPLPAEQAGRAPGGTAA
jgi:colanic acid biosynthesis glycosyl transferase WcaI